MLADRTNGIQDKIWTKILKEGQGTILPLADYTPEAFEESLNKHVKIMFKING